MWHEKKMARTIWIGVFSFVGFVGFAGLAHAQTTIARHTGDTHPAVEGWSGLDGRGENATLAPIQNDVGGFDAWQVHDNTSDARPRNVRLLSFDEVEQANRFGWVLRVRLRVVDDDGASLARSVTFSDESKSGNEYLMYFGADQEANRTQLLLRDGDENSTQVNVFVDGTGYHLYELVYDPMSETAELFVDGVPKYDGYNGQSGADDNFIIWGSRSENGVGEANYNLVELAIVPEPTSAALLGLSVGGLLLRRRSRH